MKKITAMLLVLLMLLGMLLSCKKQGSENGESTGDVEAPTGSVETNESGYVLDRLPADLSAYNGKTVKLLGWDGQSHQTIPKEDSADDPIQSTLYQHWRGIEDRFGITFNTVYTDSEWVSRDTFITAAISDQGKYDLIQTQTLFPILLAEQGYLCNLKNLNYPDLAKNEDGSTVMPWWPSSVDEYSQHGALYFIGSNSSAMTISQMSVIFVNTKLISGKGLANPVTSVVRGSWTVAEMENVVKQFTAEAEGTPAANRVYGLAIDCEDRNARLYYACGFRSIVNNADGVGQLAYDDETELLEITNALEAFKGIFVDNAAAVTMHDTDTTTELDQGRAALFLGYMEYIRNLQDVESWTVVPLPKLNFEQANYVTTFRDWADLWCMPTTTQDVELSGMLLEANACSEYNVVAPFYFEQYLKDRYSNGVEGRQCFDILRETMLYDLGVAATISGLGAEQTWRACFRGSFSNDFAETVKGQRDTLQSTLNDLLENFEKYKNNGLRE